MFDWGYDSEPEPNLDGRRIEAMRGKVLGGSSSINVMAYTRGDPGDYDRWAQSGLRGWSYDAVLPYFKRVECWEEGETHYRGSHGRVGVEWAKTRDPLFRAWIEAARMAGYRHVRDYNAGSHEGFGVSQYSIRNGRRSSASTAYLKQTLHRPNLKIITGALTTRVILEGTIATGVEFAYGPDVLSVTASKEIILSAGAFNTPQILMLSGIGPAEHLKEVGIDPIVDLPVGKNLQDHPAVLIMFSRREPGPFRREMRFDRMALSMLEAYAFGTGPATVVPGGLHAFIKTRPELAVPDIEFMFRGAPSNAQLWFPLIRPGYRDGFGIRPTLLHPESRGEVKLASNDPSAHPRIFLNLLSAPRDLATLREGFKRAREVAAQKPLDPYRGEETSPGMDITSDEEIDAFIRRTAVTAHHPACTCPMGIHPESVLDARFRVNGVQGLRVVDASAMPDLVSAHINATVLMMAEKASDMLRWRITSIFG
jgi:choline dehydrogenase-like flavoprotein